METMRKLPIGVQSFKVLRTENFLYVDKTEFIWKLVNQSRVHFLSRPRRFGKSLFLSTLKAYFLGQKELFTGLKIAELEEAQAAGTRDIWQEYPVLYLDFNAAKYETREDLEGLLNVHLCWWEDIYGKNKAEEAVSERFAGLIRRAYEKTGKQVVILVDEYDKPLLETMSDAPELNEIYRKILKGFYGVIKSSDEYLRFAFLTGVTKFSKVSIFSDLNNLQDISMLPEFSALCGITQAELEQYFMPEIEQLALANRLSVEQTLASLKQWYDGYHFSENSVNVYNPFSILNVFAGKVFRSFWFATGTPTFLVKSLQEQSEDVRELLEEAEMSESMLQDYRPDMKNPLPILFQSGYLTIKAYDERLKLYKLGFPNDEVKYGFLDNLVPAYTTIAKDKSGLFIGNFLRDIEKGNVAGFMERLYIACAGLPYSLAAKNNTKMRERDYQIAFYILFTLMGQFTQTEVVSSRGRSDCVVHTPNAIYVFEFKLMGSGTAQSALAQIKEKGYAAPYRMSGKKVVCVGAVFNDEIPVGYLEDYTAYWECEEL
ncbi:MAG: AAA family ATPase [Treponema sp.]